MSVEPLSEPGPELCAIARRAIQADVSGVELELPASALPRAGVFVTLRDARGALRGCVGSLTPVAPDLISETARAAVLAASSDPRFPPVSLEELAELAIEVTLLGAEEPVSSLSELDPAIYGIVVRAGGRRGLLLPEIPGITSAQQQVDAARDKARIHRDAQLTIGRFRVRKFTEFAGAGNEPAASPA